MMSDLSKFEPSKAEPDEGITKIPKKRQQRMSKWCEYCSHSLEDKFDCLPCLHLELRPYADNTVELKDLFVLSPSIVFCKGTPEWIKEVKNE